jgi:hypothetical protein
LQEAKLFSEVIAKIKITIASKYMQLLASSWNLAMKKSCVIG